MPGCVRCQHQNRHWLPNVHDRQAPSGHSAFGNNSASAAAGSRVDTMLGAEMIGALKWRSRFLTTFLSRLYSCRAFLAGLCPCTACFGPHARHAMLFCPNALLCVHVACMHTVLRCFADACFVMPISTDHAGGLHVAMLFEWCVQNLPSGHVGPPATAGNKRRLGKGLPERRQWHERSSSKRWRSVFCMLCDLHVSARLCRRAAYLCCIHR